jgi:hypothetical protein
MFDDNLCLIVFAKFFSILVKKVLKRDDIDCEFLVSTPSDMKLKNVCCAMLIQ